MPAVTRGVRRHPGHDAIAGEHLDERGRGFEPEQRRDLGHEDEQLGCRHRGRLDARVTRLSHLAGLVIASRVAWQRAYEGVGKLQLLDGGHVSCSMEKICSIGEGRAFRSVMRALAI